ncbi:MAG: hypothetical protein ABDK94_01315 [Atribacterota bacterium]
MVEKDFWVSDDFFKERIKVLEALLEKVEALLDEVLGKGEENEEEVEVSTQEERIDLFELFIQLLSTLKEKEDNTLKVPWTRWKTIQSRSTLNFERITLSDLLALYHIYIDQDERTREFPIDDSFEKLLIERRAVARRIVQGNSNGPLPMELFFQDCRNSRSTIATFLVLLDLVFHKELRMIESQGKIYFEKNGAGEILEKPS